jgi:hypothetical protein
LCCSPNDVLSIDTVSIRLSFIINRELSWIGLFLPDIHAPHACLAVFM